MRDAPAVLKDQARPVIRVTVTDDGKGLPAEIKPSYGIAGMTERVWATGGEMKMTNRPGGGVKLDAWVPVAGRPSAAEGSLANSQPLRS